MAKFIFIMFLRVLTFNIVKNMFAKIDNIWRFGASIPDNLSATESASSFQISTIYMLI